MRPTTRLRILEYLQKRQTASVRELGRALAMTGANIRHHLGVLESDELIEAISRRQEGRGRPMTVYGLSRRVLGDGMNELAEAMFDVWLKDAADEVQETGLRSVARRLVGENLPAPNIPVPQRLALAIGRLNGLHYQARWEASAAGPRILLEHCPYAAIIGRYPELCRMDAYLLELQLVLPVRQTAKLERRAAGLPQCTFIVG